MMSYFLCHIRFTCSLLFLLAGCVYLINYNFAIPFLQCQLTRAKLHFRIGCFFVPSFEFVLRPFVSSLTSQVGGEEGAALGRGGADWKRDSPFRSDQRPSFEIVNISLFIIIFHLTRRKVGEPSTPNIPK